MAGADVITYNLPGNPKLKLDGDAVVSIFLGNITKWNDPKIAALNPGVGLPDLSIIPVHRSDGSGTTFIFTDYLSTISPVWTDSVGKGTSVKWPASIGIGAKGNEGVAGQVKQLSGAIGYVELIYAKQNQMPYAEMKNAAGNFVTPSLDSVTAALATARFRTISVFRWSTRPATTLIRSPAQPGCWFMKSKRIPPRAKNWWNS